MSQYNNPYQPPQMDVPALAPEATSDPAAVPDHIVEHLRGTRPWVFFLAVVGFLGGGLMVLAGLAMLVMSSAAKLPAWLGLIYIVLAAVCILPSVYMVMYGSSIGRLMRDPRMERLGAALAAQRTYWKAVGIMCAVMIALYPIVIVVAVVAGMKGLGR
jgi:hypothetical protein